MRPSMCLFLSALLFLEGSARAQTLLSQQQPMVVYEGSRTLSAQPYYTRLKRKDSEPAAGVTAPDDAGILPLEDRLPLSPTQLRVGQPQMKTIPGLITPLFIMGMDDLSLTWFGRAAEGLSDMGARGIVVQATARSAWLALQRRAQAAGIDLMLLEGDAIAHGYGLNTYPTVLLSPSLAGQGSHE